MGRWKLPPERDFKFYQRRKKDSWREISAPVLEGPVADSHTHVHMLPDPAWELARCAANNVDLICDVADPTEDDMARIFGICELSPQVNAYLREAEELGLEAAEVSGAESKLAPMVYLAVGVHPHNADKYTQAMEDELQEYLLHPEVRVLGEVGLDYYYDNSERDAQREVFRHQISLAKELEMPIALHLRSGKDVETDNAHSEALEILTEEGFPEKGALLHCCSLSPDELQPWIDAGCFIAYGGALTFKDADKARAGAKLVPLDRLLLETDAPYMTPEPMRGATCTPSHVIFTAEKLAEVRGVTPGKDRQEFLRQLYKNTQQFLGID